MPSSKKLQPIIIKRVRKTSHGHHGGAWKIAYADFVTAMMAFFLLMWLLGSTTSGQLQGIADYFNSPLHVALPGGDGSGAATSIVPGGGQDLTRAVGQVHGKAEVHAARRMTIDDARDTIASQDKARIENLRRKMETLIQNDARLKEFSQQIRLEVIPDGLRVEIVDAQNRPMFDTGSAVLKPYMKDILERIGSGLNGLENRVMVAGHTDATPYGGGTKGYSNWELSADRANASRRELVAAGMPDDKLVRIVGMAASQLIDVGHPAAAVNRRISLTVLTQEAEARLSGRRPANESAAQGWLESFKKIGPTDEPPQGSGDKGLSLIHI